jgi:hypothetical protein
MAEDGRNQAFAVDVGTRLADAIGQCRDRHAHVSDDAHAHISDDVHATGTQGQRGVISQMARAPELRAVFRPTGPVEADAAMRGRNFLCQIGLFLDGQFSAMEFREQRR